MPQLNSRDGFTLLEVVIAVSIFAVGMLAIATLQLTSITGNSGARSVTEATTLGQEQAEKLLSLPYDHPVLSSGSHRLDRYNCSYTWEVTEDDPLPGTKSIRLDVIMKSGGRSKHLRIIVTKADLI